MLFFYFCPISSSTFIRAGRAVQAPPVASSNFVLPSLAYAILFHFQVSNWIISPRLLKWWPHVSSVTLRPPDNPHGLLLLRISSCISSKDYLPPLKEIKSACSFCCQSIAPLFFDKEPQGQAQGQEKTIAIPYFFISRQKKLPEKRIRSTS